MRIPVPLAWAMLVMTFFTAALLRQFHDRLQKQKKPKPRASLDNGSDETKYHSDIEGQ